MAAPLAMSALDLKGRRVLIRADLNAPIEDGHVRSDARLRADPLQGEHPGPLEVGQHVEPHHPLDRGDGGGTDEGRDRHRGALRSGWRQHLVIRRDGPVDAVDQVPRPAVGAQGAGRPPRRGDVHRPSGTAVARPPDLAGVRRRRRCS